MNRVEWERATFSSIDCFCLLQINFSAQTTREGLSSGKHPR